MDSPLSRGWIVEAFTGFRQMSRVFVSVSDLCRSGVALHVNKTKSREEADAFFSVWSVVFAL